MKSLLVEGWLGVNHSYAMVNQYQLLEMMKYDVDLFHVAMPYLKSEWSPVNNPDGFDADKRAKIAAIPAPPPGFSPDVTFRLDFPYRFNAAPGHKVFVFGTAELQSIAGFDSDNSLADGIANPNLRIVTPSHWSKAGFVKAGFPEDRVHVVAHGVDSGIFKPADPQRRKQVRTKLGLGDNEFAVLSVGAMTQNKGVDLLIAAYAILRLKYPRLRLVLKDARKLHGITGESVFEPLAKHRPDLMNDALRDSIIFISDNLTLPEMAELYAAADCYASPYRAEGFNIPPLEAAACGVPIIVTKGGSTDDYQHESFALQVRGFPAFAGELTMIEPDLNSLIDSLTLVIEGKADKLDRAYALAHINEHFSWAAAARKLMALFSAA